MVRGTSQSPNALDTLSLERRAWVPNELIWGRFLEFGNFCVNLQIGFCDSLAPVMSDQMGGYFTLPKVPLAGEDPLYRLMREFREDDHESKIDLGIGAYRDENGRPWVLPVVKKVSCVDRAERDRCLMFS